MSATEAKPILIVDDSATTRSVIKRVVRMSTAEGVELLEAANGQDALNVLAERSVQLVMTDLNMPVMDGYEMIRRMSADTALRAVPVVVISAQPDPAVVEGLKQQGVRGYLPKPFTPEAVRDLLTTTC